MRLVVSSFYRRFVLGHLQGVGSLKRCLKHAWQKRWWDVKTIKQCSNDSDDMDIIYKVMMYFATIITTKCEYVFFLRVNELCVLKFSIVIVWACCAYKLRHKKMLLPKTE